MSRSDARRAPTYRFHGSKPPKEGERTPILAEAPEPVVKDGVATMRLFDVIDSWGGPWGLSAKEFADTLDKLDADVSEIHLLINSPGGDAFDGVAIMNVLRRHDAKVVAVVEGLAASAASFIAASADELVMAKGAELMVHDAWGICIGPASDMQKMANDLDHVSDNIASVYADKAGGGKDFWRAAMKEETWYNAEEAVASGIADRVDEATERAQNTFDLSIFDHSGRKDAPPPPLPKQEVGSTSITIEPVFTGSDRTELEKAVNKAMGELVAEMREKSPANEPAADSEPAEEGMPYVRKARHRMTARRHGLPA